MAVATKANNVDDSVGPPGRPPVGRQGAGKGNSVGVVGADVQNGGAGRPSQVGGVRAGARLRRRRGKPHLVVGDDVQRPPRRVTGHPGQRQGFRHYTQPRKRGVAVDEQARNRTVPQDGLLRAHLGGATTHGMQPSHLHHHHSCPMPPAPPPPHHAQHDGPHRLQVAGVGGHRHVQGPGWPPARPRAVGQRGGTAEVVLDVADRKLRLGRLHFSANLAGRRAQDVGQHIKPTPVGGSHLQAGDAVGGAALGRRGDADQQAFNALQPKSLGAGEAPGEEGFKRPRPGQQAQGGPAGGWGGWGPCFQPRRQPRLLRGRQVGQLGRQRAAIG